MIVALCGGVGGSKTASGLYRVLPPHALTVIVNTADDLEFCGLHVSPDIDTVVYTLAGIAGKEAGWGIEGDTFAALDTLKLYGAPTWFAVGDRDLATDVFRTHALGSGTSLTAVTAMMAQALGVQATVLPMTDDPVSTRLSVEGEWIEFQEYFVHRRHQDRVDDVRYDGIDAARPTEAVLDALCAADGVVIVNSNPVLSILPALSMPPLREAVRSAPGPRVAISPIVGGDAVSGPAGDLMRLVDQPSSVIGVAHLYKDVVNGMVIDCRDTSSAAEIEAMGLRVLVTDTIMRVDEDRARLAGEALAFLESLR